MVAQGQNGEASFQAPGAAQQVAGHGLGGADRDLLGVLAPQALDRHGLHFVAHRGGGAMGVDVGDLLRFHVRVAERGLHDPAGATGVLGRLGDVVGVAAHPVADHLGQDGRAAALGHLQRLQDQDAGALADDEAVALGVERAAGALRLVVAGGQRPHGGEAAHAHRGDGGFGAAADHDVGVAPGDDLEAVAHRMGRGRAGGGGGRVRPPGPGANGDVPGRQVDDAGRDEEGGDLAGAALQQLLVLPLDHVEAADPRADVNPGAVGQPAVELQLGVLDGKVGGGQGEVDEPAHLLHLFFLDHLERVEVLHLAREPAGMLGGVEEGDGPDAALPRQGGLPNFLGAHPVPAQQTHPGDDYATSVARGGRAHGHTSGGTTRAGLAGNPNTGETRTFSFSRCIRWRP